MANQHTEDTLKDRLYAWLDDNHDRIEELGCHNAGAWLVEHTDLDGTKSTLRTYVQEYRQDRDLDRRTEHNSEKEFADESPFLEDYIDRENVYYNDRDDVYIVWFNKKAHPVDGDDYRAMKRAYSNWDDDEETIPEVARKFGFSDSEFRKFKDACGWTHDSSIFSEEEIEKGETHDGETFHENLLRRREQQIYRDWQKRKWKETEKEAKKWRDFKLTTIEPVIQGLENAPKMEPPETEPQPGSETLMLAGEFDRHLNKRMGEEGFYRNQHRWHSAIQEVKRDTEKFDPDRCVVVLGGDLFHVDRFDEKTTRGTRQSTDLPQQQATRKTAEAAAKAIELYRDVAKATEVMVLPGNHDYRTSMLLVWALEQRYSDCLDVQVWDQCDPYQYYQFGNNLIGLHHGHIKYKQQDLVEQMMSDSPEGLGRCPCKYWFIGDKHHYAAKEGATLQEQAPTTTEQGEWETRQGFPEGHQVAVNWLFDRERGQFARFFEGPRT